MVPLVLVGQLPVLWWALRRYAVGADGPIAFLGQEVWQPRVGSIAVVAAFATGLVVAGLAASWPARASAAPAEPAAVTP